MGIAGTVVGGPIGGIAGSLLGYYSGDDVGKFLYDIAHGKEPPINKKLLADLGVARQGSMKEGMIGNTYAINKAKSTGLLQAMTSGLESGEGETVGKFMAMRSQAHADLATSMGIDPDNLKYANFTNKKFINAKAAIDADILEQYNKATAVTPNGNGANGGTTIINEGDIINGGGKDGEGGVEIDVVPQNKNLESQRDNYDPYGSMSLF